MPYYWCVSLERSLPTYTRSESPMTLIAPAQMPLSVALKEQTTAAHASAETSRFMSNLSGGQLLSLIHI